MYNNEFLVIYNLLSLIDVLIDLYVLFICNCWNFLVW